MKRNKILGLLAIMVLCLVAAFAAACGASGSGTSDSGGTDGSTGDTTEPTDGYTGTTGFEYTGYTETREVTTDEAAISYYAISGIGTALGETNVYIPKTYRQKPVSEIGEEVFLGNKSIRSVTIMENIKYVGVGAFANCVGLSRMILASTFSEGIDENAFYGCTALTVVEFTGSVADWCTLLLGNAQGNPLSNGAVLYINGELLTELVVPDTVTTISPAVFYGCKSLESVSMGESVTEIGADAFSDCINLTSLTIGTKVETIGVGAFYRNSSLASVVIPDGVKEISRYTFSLCANLADVKMSDEVTAIGDYAFYGCTSLYNMVIGSKLATIGKGAYMGSALEAVLYNGTAADWAKVTVGEDNARIATVAVFVYSEERAAGRCWHYDEGVPVMWASENLHFSGLDEEGAATDVEANIVSYMVSKGTVTGTDIVIPETYLGKPVTNISSEGFMNEAYTSVYIPSTVVEIGAEAFMGCTALTSLVVPAKVAIIGAEAFNGCTALKSLDILGSATLGKNAYSGCTALEYITIGGSTIWFTDPPAPAEPAPDPEPDPDPA